jgi:hypothetical protein
VFIVATQNVKFVEYVWPVLWLQEWDKQFFTVINIPMTV